MSLEKALGRLTVWVYFLPKLSVTVTTTVDDGDEQVVVNMWFIFAAPFAPVLFFLGVSLFSRREHA